MNADLRLPGTDVRVKVVDMEDGMAIPGATVFARLRSSQRTIKSDDRGEAVLPPMKPGKTRIGVQAAGYLRKAQEVDIADMGAAQVFEVRLERTREDRNVRLTMPDGSPARRSAIVIAMPRGALRSDCDGNGLCAVPAEAKDENAAFAVGKGAGLTRVSIGEALRNRSIRLAPLAPALIQQVRRSKPDSRVELGLDVSDAQGPIPREALDAAAAVNGAIARSLSMSPEFGPFVLNGLANNTYSLSARRFTREGTGDVVCAITATPGQLVSECVAP